VPANLLSPSLFPILRELRRSRLRAPAPSMDGLVVWYMHASQPIRFAVCCIPLSILCINYWPLCPPHSFLFARCTTANLSRLFHTVQLYPSFFLYFFTRLSIANPCRTCAFSHPGVFLQEHTSPSPTTVIVIFPFHGTCPSPLGIPSPHLRHALLLPLPCCLARPYPMSAISNCSSPCCRPSSG